MEYLVNPTKFESTDFCFYCNCKGEWECSKSCSYSSCPGNGCDSLCTGRFCVAPGVGPMNTGVAPQSSSSKY